MGQMSQRSQLESARQQRDSGRLAFKHWLKLKQDRTILKKKERVYRDQVERLKEESLAEDKMRAEESYQTWKNQKEFESKLHRKNEREINDMFSSPRRGNIFDCVAIASFVLYMCSPVTRCLELTPALPGYVSVWSCDSELANILVDKVDRRTHLLSEINPGLHDDSKLGIDKSGQNNF